MTLALMLVLAAAPGELVWRSPDTLGKGVSHTYTAIGTRKGEAYVFRARGECRWSPKQIVTRYGTILRDRPDRIFGIDFRVKFGEQEKRFLDVGEAQPVQTELVFVADRDDVTVQIVDAAFGLPQNVNCWVDGLEIVAAPPAQ